MDKYSYKDFTNKTFTDLPADEFTGITITGSCFYQEGEEREIFPPEAKNITFKKCNLDNVVLPANSKVVSCSQMRIVKQNDKCDWFVDKDKKPIEPVGKAAFLRAGISVQPKDIPSEMLDKSVLDAADKTVLGGDL